MLTNDCNVSVHTARTSNKENFAGKDQKSVQTEVRAGVDHEKNGIGLDSR